MGDRLGDTVGLLVVGDEVGLSVTTGDALGKSVGGDVTGDVLGEEVTSVATGDRLGDTVGLEVVVGGDRSPTQVFAPLLYVHSVPVPAALHPFLSPL